jgi:integrase
MRAERAAARRTPRWPSSEARNAAKRVTNPQRQPADRYQVTSYWHAIAKGYDRAFPAPPPLGQRKVESKSKWLARLTEAQKAELGEWQKHHRWHPNQLGHSFAIEVRREHGLEAAQVLLGHSRADVTQVYAERNTEPARKVAERIG